METQWSKHLGLKVDDVQRVQNHSKLKHPFGFLLFLEKASRVKDVTKMSRSDLISLKRSVMEGEKIEEECEASASSSSKVNANLNSCRLKYFCNLDKNFNLLRSFETNLNHLENSTITMVNLGNNNKTNSITDAANKVWQRDFSKNTSDTRFIPEQFLEKISDIPKEMKEPFVIVKQIISSCERLKPSKKFKSNTIDMNRLAKDMNWAQNLVDVWQEEECDPSLIWQEEAWLDILVAPLNQSDLAKKVQEHLQSDPSPDIQKFLNTTFPEKSPDEIKEARASKSREEFEEFLNSKHMITRQKQELTKFLNSSSLFLGAFLVGQVLGLKGPQSECLVQKNGTLVGDQFEKEVFKALQMSASRFPFWNTIFCGLEVLGIEQRCNEFDFLIILGQVKKILYVECKYTLTEEVAKKIHKQSNNAFKYLQARTTKLSGRQG